MRIMEVSDVVIPMMLDEVDVRDRGDVKILECALSGGSDYIVTGDEDLLSLGDYRGNQYGENRGTVGKIIHE